MLHSSGTAINTGSTGYTHNSGNRIHGMVCNARWCDTIMLAWKLPLKRHANPIGCVYRGIHAAITIATAQHVSHRL